MGEPCFGEPSCGTVLARLAIDLLQQDGSFYRMSLISDGITKSDGDISRHSSILNENGKLGGLVSILQHGANRDKNSDTWYSWNMPQVCG